MADSIDFTAMERVIDQEYLRAKAALQTLRKYFEQGSSSHVSSMVIYPTIPESADVDVEYVDVEDNPQSIIGKVDAVMNADPTKKWTVASMIAYLQHSGFSLAAKKPEATMGLVFTKLRNRGKIRIVRRGSGRNPNVYRGALNPPHGGMSEQPKLEQAAS